MHRPLAIALVTMTACGAQLGDGILPNELPDASGIDAAVNAPDAPPDARPCAGGDNRATDPSGACFLFFVGPKTRAAAEADCIANAAHLAKIEDATQNATVLSLAIGRDAFIGATDVVAEGTYLWHDGTPLGFTNFRAGEPNNANGQFEEDCLVLEGARDGTWDDRPCAPGPVGTGSYAYVCQF